MVGKVSVCRFSPHVQCSCRVALFTLLFFSIFETFSTGVWLFTQRCCDRGSPNIEMDEETFLVNRERAVDYLNSLEKVPDPFQLKLLLCIFTAAVYLNTLQP